MRWSQFRSPACLLLLTRERWISFKVLVAFALFCCVLFCFVLKKFLVIFSSWMKVAKVYFAWAQCNILGKHCSFFRLVEIRSSQIFQGNFGSYNVYFSSKVNLLSTNFTVWWNYLESGWGLNASILGENAIYFHMQKIWYYLLVFSENDASHICWSPTAPPPSSSHQMMRVNSALLINITDFVHIISSTTSLKINI